MAKAISGHSTTKYAMAIVAIPVAPPLAGSVTVLVSREIFCGTLHEHIRMNSRLNVTIVRCATCS